MDADQILARLRDPSPDSALARLADLAADALLDTRLDELVEPAAAAAAIVELVRAHLDAPPSHRAIEARIEALLRRVEAEDGAVADFLPPELRGALEDLADRPWAPRQELVLAWLDRAPIRRLLRRLFLEALVAFGKRLPIADSRITRGLGDIGRFAKEAALGRAGAFGAITAEVVGAVSGEVERQLERKAGEFVDAALSGILRRLAELLADPALADEQAELRRALLQAFFDLSAVQIADEARRADPAAVGALLREWLARWVARDEAQDELARAIAAFLGEDGPRPFADLLAVWGVEDLGRDLVAAFLEARLRPFVASDPFATWLRALLAD